MSPAARAAEMAARASYGKLLAILCSRSGDIAAAEDALSEAFAKALVKWSERGVPENPDGWLLTSARNSLTDRYRRAVRFPELSEIPDQVAAPSDAQLFADHRFALMFVCAHPAIAADLHAPLMLQTVLGLHALEISRAFVVPPSAMSQRLVRAKRKIREAHIPFRIPEGEDLPLRMDAVREAIYAAHALDWLEPRDALGLEALYLADLLVGMSPDDPETLGLAALIAFGQARSRARIEKGVLIPIDQQDMALWDDALIAYGYRNLAKAQKLRRVGAFQIEAAIQSVHLNRRQSGETDWSALDKLYFALNKISPSLGARVAHAVVIGKLRGPEAGLMALDRLETTGKINFQPVYAARTELFAFQGNKAEAVANCEKAISLTTEIPLRRFLEQRLLKLNQI